MRRLVLGLAAVAVCASACSSGPAPHLSTGPLRLSTTTEAPPATPVPVTTSAAPTTTAPPATTTTHAPAGRPTTTRPKPRPTTKPAAPPPLAPPPVAPTIPPTIPPTSAAPVVPDRAMLSIALLTASDLPGQFGNAGTPSGVGDSSLSGCPTLSSDPAGATATASVALADTPVGTPGVTEVLMQFPAASATQAMASFAALPTTCPTVTANLQGTPVSFTTAPLAIPSLGDASTAARLTGPLPGLGATIYEDVVAIRHENTMVFVLVTALSADTDLTTTAAGAAYARVAARW